jgi:hypothetical protein
MEKEIVGSTPTPATNAGKLKKTRPRFNLVSSLYKEKMKIKLPKLSSMEPMDQAAWKGFITGMIIAVLTLAPFVLLALALIATGWGAFHTHDVPMP